MNTINQTVEKPEIGQLVNVYGRQCRIVKVRPLGTIDVITIQQPIRSYRVSGLAFI